MNSDRVYILHAADGDCPVCTIAHYFKLDFLVAFDRLLYQNLMYRRQVECVDCDIFELFFVVCETAAGSSERKRRPQHYRITYVKCCLLSFFNAVCDLTRDDRLANGLAHLLEKLSVLCSFDGFAWCSEQLNAALIKNAFLLQLHRQIEACLPADSRHDRVRSLVSEYFCYVFKCKRLHIDLVCNCSIGHDGSRI